MSEPKGRGVAWTDAPKGRGAAWTEERGARNERRGTREGGALSAPEAHRKQSLSAAYAVHFERCAEPRYIPVIFYAYLAVVVPFVIWRTTIVNWHIWFGPLSLAADLFAAMMFTFFLGFTRYLYVPVHRPAHVTARVVDCLIPTHTEPVSLIEPTVIAALRVRGVRDVLVLGNFDRPDVRAMAGRLGV